MKWLGEEMQDNIPLELDFIKEGKNADRCRKIFENEEQIKVPEVYWQYTNVNFYCFFFFFNNFIMLFRIEY